MMKNRFCGWCVVAACLCVAACSQKSEIGWTPVSLGPPRAPVSPNEVLITDDYPLTEYVNVGYFAAPEGKVARVSLDDKPLVDYLTTRAAAMGGNTVVVREPRIQFRSGEGKSTRVDVIYVREEMGTHGADDAWSNSLPIDEETLRIY